MQKLLVATSGLISLVCNLTFCNLTSAGEPVHVLVWDERQPRQAEAYDNFLGNEIAKRLKQDPANLELRSAALEDPDQGLSAGNLEWADVIVWWGHVRHSDVSPEISARILDYIRAGEVDLIALHSAHWARPFVDAMNWKTVEDAKSHFAKHLKDSQVDFDLVAPPKERTVPAHGSMRTPAYFGYRAGKKKFKAIVHLPWCCFPDYRADGLPSQITVELPEHPIASGLPAQFEIAKTEMYNEPFHVPEPDQVVFTEKWELGEHFRSGMVWNIGKGKVFYFRPGHEQYPVFKQPEMLKVIVNACLWLGAD